jgi:hypothetical protein
LPAHASGAAAEWSRVDESRRLAETALDLARRSGDDEALLDAIWARHRCADPNMDVADIVRLGEQATALAQRLGLPVDESFGRLVLLDAAIVLADLISYDAGLVQLTESSRSQHLLLGWWHVHRAPAARAVLLGQFDEAREHPALARGIRNAWVTLPASSSTTASRWVWRGRAGDGSELTPRFFGRALAGQPVPILELPAALGQMIASDGKFGVAGYFRPSGMLLPFAATRATIWSARRRDLFRSRGVGLRVPGRGDLVDGTSCSCRREVREVAPIRCSLWVRSTCCSPGSRW